MTTNNEPQKEPVTAGSECSAELGDDTETKLYYALRERDLWMRQCLESESKVEAYEDVFANCRPVNREFRSNYAPSMIRLRWLLDQPTELDRAVKERGDIA